MIIAEIGTSHEGSREAAFSLIHAARDAGADAVKFQWVYADEILHPKTGEVSLPTGRIPLYERFRQLERGPDFFAAMRDEARRSGMKFVCSPFGIRSMEELWTLGPDAIKIASPELNHIPLLRRLSELNAGENEIPVIVSSGVSTLADIERALGIVGAEGVTLLHCVTSYPAPPEDYNLRLLRNLAAVTGASCGVSDHSADPVLVPVLSVAMGGRMIEKHIALSNGGSGLDDPVALEPEKFAQMVMAVHQAEAVARHYSDGNLNPVAERAAAEIIRQMAEQYGAELVERTLGSGVKRLAPSERANYGRTNRSLHYTRDIAAGERVAPGDIAVLRTEKILSPGVPPEFYDALVGKRLSVPASDGAGVRLEDFME